MALVIDVCEREVVGGIWTGSKQNIRRLALTGCVDLAEARQERNCRCGSRRRCRYCGSYMRVRICGGGGWMGMVESESEGVRRRRRAKCGLGHAYPFEHFAPEVAERLYI